MEEGNGFQSIAPLGELAFGARLGNPVEWVCDSIL